MSEWINVKDRKPEWPCIVYDGMNQPYVPNSWVEAHTEDGEVKYIPDYPIENMLNGENPKYVKYPILWWAPIPTLPKKGE